MLTIASPEAYAELDRVELLDAPNATLWEIRSALPNHSMLAAYLDDFLPGNPSQWSRGKLRRYGSGWQLLIGNQIVDGTGEWIFTANGDFAR